MSDILPTVVDILDSLTASIERHSIQIFANADPADEEHLPKSIGSGVLLSHGAGHYIATAAHVIDNQGDTHIGVYSRIKDFFELGTSCQCPDNQIDVAVWYVEPYIASGIAPEDWWYPIEDCVLGHNEVTEERYFIYGFPATKYHIDLTTKAIIQKPFRYFTRGYSSNPHAGKAAIDRSIHLLLEFHKKKICDIRTGIKESAPVPYGMSGCGLWYFDGRKFRLAGIMTDWKQPTENIPALMATKIDYIHSAINFLESSVI